MSLPLVSAIGLGALHGVRHVFEPDHLATVSAIATDGRGTRTAMYLGAIWGVGHLVALLTMCGAAMAAGAAIPAAVMVVVDLAIGGVLVALGANAIRAPRAAGARAFGGTRRSLCVGLLHGLAGSGALTALVIAELPGMAARVAFVVLFGAASILGMAALSGAIGAPLARTARRPRVAKALRVAAGASAIAVGITVVAGVVGGAP